MSKLTASLPTTVFPVLPPAPPGGSEGTAPDRFLAAVAGGAGIPRSVYAADAHLDATVPGWRFSVDGAQAIADEYGGWFEHPGHLEELARHVVDWGEVVTYLLTWTQDGVPHASHHVHLLRLDEEGLIASDTVFCGGRWDAALLAQMAEAGR